MRFMIPLKDELISRGGKYRIISGKEYALMFCEATKGR